ncbi:hypothetical protein QPK31_24840 [Massilia sp. YIM B02769]|uniref:hypothetical protein n=1 Tax=Massilia sp. YIM B02769 TaxID=3050129 RepID=UPI0025B6FD8D|nr:hypothetical protein [Massilia sp. YIM B02769]MDN4061453.1 hypothetical protein [Massilia sp. YIM B02769]
MSARNHHAARGRSAVGSVDPMLMGLVAFILLTGVVVAFTPRDVEAPQQPAPAPGAGIAYAPYVFADHDTGCQYLSTHNSAGLAPRIAADGTTHMGCGAAQ